jgi:hypothetical protein
VILLVSAIVTPHLAGMMPRMKVNARARTAAGKLNARRFPDIPGYFPVLRGNSRFGDARVLKQLFDILHDFEMSKAESNNFPVNFPVQGNLLLTRMQ